MQEDLMFVVDGTRYAIVEGQSIVFKDVSSEAATKRLKAERALMKRILACIDAWLVIAEPSDGH